MSLKTTHGDDNLVIEEALTVTDCFSIVEGTWSYTSANVSGWYNTMKECHRFARKSFRYVGMTYAAAKTCRTAMITLFTRTVKMSYWADNVMGGQWNVNTSGTRVTADVSIVPSGGDAWDVAVSVNEDDVRMIKATDVYSYSSLFADERARSYGSDGHGSSAETE